MVEDPPERYLGPKIVGSSIALAVGYGLIQDQITIRICPEYFTVWHPNPLQIDGSTQLALYWGVAATWWVGLILGIIVAAVATVGEMPKPKFGVVLRRLIWLILATGLCTVFAGLVAQLTGFMAPPAITGPKIEQLADAERHRFAVDWAAHNMAYLSAFVGAMVVSGLTWFGRYKAMIGRRWAGLS
jgi:hypothetical protein